jgi:hypothetical protein
MNNLKTRIIFAAMQGLFRPLRSNLSHHALNPRQILERHCDVFIGQKNGQMRFFVFTESGKVVELGTTTPRSLEEILAGISVTQDSALDYFQRTRDFAMLRTILDRVVLQNRRTVRAPRSSTREEFTKDLERYNKFVEKIRQVPNAKERLEMLRNEDSAVIALCLMTSATFKVLPEFAPRKQQEILGLFAKYKDFMATLKRQ